MYTDCKTGHFEGRIKHCIDPIHLTSSSTIILVGPFCVLYSEVRVLANAAFTCLPVDSQNNQHGAVTSHDMCTKGVNKHRMFVDYLNSFLSIQSE